MSHTPTQRTASYQKDEKGWRVFIPIGDDLRDAYDYFVVGDERTAAFIVRAVNSHEELLGLVKSLVGALPYGYATLEREANAAIAKAEGLK